MTAFITGLPRSRTLWFSEYFKGLGVACHHEFLNGCTSREQFYAEMRQPGVINSDCGLVLTNFQERFPKAPTVIIRRKFEDVVSSLKRLELCSNEVLLQLCRMGQQLQRLRGLHVEFDDIDARLPEIHRYLCSAPYYEQYAADMCRKNIQLKTITGDTDSYRLWVA